MPAARKPTQNAEMFFNRAFEQSLTATHALTRAGRQEGNPDVAMIECLGSLARGMAELSIGVRATYQLLEKVFGQGNAVVTMEALQTALAQLRAARGRHTP